MTTRNGRPGFIRDFVTGVGMLVRGLTVWTTAPKLMWLGMIPALIVGAVTLAGLIALGINLDNIATLVTPFANDWDEPYRTGIHAIAGLAFVVVALLLVVYTFTTVTLMVGGPFYEQIWKHVESGFGQVPQPAPRGFWRTFGRAVGTGLRMLLPAVLVGLMLFVLGFIPVIGQILVPVLGALFGGWFIAVELTGVAFDARDLTLTQRRRVLRGRRAMTLGFGLATYLAFLIPLGAVIMMPAAVAGATLLARAELGEAVRTSPTTTD